jgi:hypothetical protein
MNVQTLLISLIIAILCALGAFILKTNKKNILASISDLVQKAEKAVEGTGLGAEKKRWVITQLEAAGTKVTAWVDAEIDAIVDLLNKKSGWKVTTTTSVDAAEVKENTADLADCGGDAE